MANLVKTLKPIQDFITTSATLHLSLCSIAEAAFAMGPNSGAKRTILLAASRHSFLALDELIAMFADAEGNAQYQNILFEMNRSGLIRFESQQGKTTIALTESGREKVKVIVKYESAMASFLPKDLTLADINKAIQCMARMQEMIENIKQLDQSDVAPVAV